MFVYNPTIIFGVLKYFLSELTQRSVQPWTRLYFENRKTYFFLETQRLSARSSPTGVHAAAFSESRQQTDACWIACWGVETSWRHPNRYRYHCLCPISNCRCLADNFTGHFSWFNRTIFSCVFFDVNAKFRWRKILKILLGVHKKTRFGVLTRFVKEKWHILPHVFYKKNLVGIKSGEQAGHYVELFLYIHSVPPLIENYCNWPVNNIKAFRANANQSSNST